MKKIFRNSFLTIELYWKGLGVGIFLDDDNDIMLLLPFVSIRVIPTLVPRIYVWGLLGFMVGFFITKLLV